MLQVTCQTIATENKKYFFYKNQLIGVRVQNELLGFEFSVKGVKYILLDSKDFSDNKHNFDNDKVKVGFTQVQNEALRLQLAGSELIKLGLFLAGSIRVDNKSGEVSVANLKDSFLPHWDAYLGGSFWLGGYVERDIFVLKNHCKYLPTYVRYYKDCIKLSIIEISDELGEMANREETIVIKKGVDLSPLKNAARKADAVIVNGLISTYDINSENLVFSNFSGSTTVKVEDIKSMTPVKTPYGVEAIPTFIIETPKLMLSLIFVKTLT